MGSQYHPPVKPLNKNLCIRKAEDEVSTAYPFATQWKFKTLDHQVEAWRESQPADFVTIQWWRKQELVNRARFYLGKEAINLSYSSTHWKSLV